MRKRLLVVEDTRALAENIADLFRMEGYDVDVTENGLEGLRQIRRAVYDLVITDLIMPVMGGEDLVRNLKAEAPGVPVILITARQLDETQQDNLKAVGVDLILNKTVEIDMLLDYVLKLSGKSDE